MLYALWALPAGVHDRLDEELLVSCDTAGACRFIVDIARDEGFHSFRMTELDGEFPDFITAMGLTRARRSQ